MPINVSRPFSFPDPPKVMPRVVNAEALAESLKGVLLQELVNLLPDLSSDLLQVTNQIAPVLTSAALAGDTKLKGELIAQIELIADINRIRGNAAALNTIKNIASVVLSVLSIGITAAVGRIPSA